MARAMRRLCGMQEQLKKEKDNWGGSLMVGATITNSEGDVLLANTMPQAEYMYGCCPTAVAMLLGYYDLYGYRGKDLSDLIDGDVDLNERGLDGDKFNMNAFDTTLGRAAATEDYEHHSRNLRRPACLHGLLLLRDPVYVSFGAANLGASSSGGFDAVIYIDGEAKVTLSSLSIAAESVENVRNLSVPFDLGSGLFHICVALDPQNTIQERVAMLTSQTASASTAARTYQATPRQPWVISRSKLRMLTATTRAFSVRARSRTMRH